MPIYRTATGLYVGTQAEAGKGFETIELPASKAETLGLLNEAARNRLEKPEDTGPPIEEDEPIAKPKGTVCSLCGRDPLKTEKAAKLLADGIEADAIALAERVRGRS